MAIGFDLRPGAGVEQLASERPIAIAGASGHTAFTGQALRPRSVMVYDTTPDDQPCQTHRRWPKGATLFCQITATMLFVTR